MKRKPLEHRPSDDPYKLADKGLSEVERQAAMASPPIIQSPEPPPIGQSPTGKPFVDPRWVPWLGLLVAAATAVAIKQPDLVPSSEVDQHIAVLVTAILGWLSPGLRHRL